MYQLKKQYTNKKFDQYQSLSCQMKSKSFSKSFKFGKNNNTKNEKNTEQTNKSMNKTTIFKLNKFNAKKSIEKKYEYEPNFDPNLFKGYYSIQKKLEKKFLKNFMIQCRDPNYKDLFFNRNKMINKKGQYLSPIIIAQNNFIIIFMNRYGIEVNQKLQKSPPQGTYSIMLNKQNKENTFCENRSYISPKLKFKMKWKTLSWLKKNKNGNIQLIRTNEISKQFIKSNNNKLIQSYKLASNIQQRVVYLNTEKRVIRRRQLFN